MAKQITISVGRTYSHVDAIRSGRIDIRGVDPSFVDGPTILPAARAMVRALDYDVVEMPLTTYMVARSVGKPLIALPVFPARSMPHMYMFRNRELLDDPSQLPGTKVGVRAYTVTTAVWARGVLRQRYGIDPRDIVWITADEEHVIEFQRPSNVVRGSGASLIDMLLAGDVAAVLGDNIDVEAHGHLDYLIPSPSEAAGAWLDEGHPYPLNHTIVIREELAAREPEIVKALADAFEAARQLAMVNPEEMITPACNPSPKDREFAKGQIRERPITYGLEANRSALAKLMEFARDQQILGSDLEVDDFFVDIN